MSTLNVKRTIDSRKEGFKLNFESNFLKLLDKDINDNPSGLVKIDSEEVLCKLNGILADVEVSDDEEMPEDFEL